MLLNPKQDFTMFALTLLAIAAIVVILVVIWMIKVIDSCADCGKKPANNRCNSLACHKKLCDSCVVRTTNKPDSCYDHSTLPSTEDECPTCHKEGGRKGMSAYSPTEICELCIKYDGAGNGISKNEEPILIPPQGLI